ncbi:D-glycero-alpha-D-manno-heptose-1,7-bisphosphate 7-phosphatase [Butyrivibrio sp. VCD2006]|uniref:D-glycero-alpha-D-manno-heptose-1,7-bisphosphate 7-phosphatase n=1 Tax=Butyrivibrio sp. VCD2006 TaxID=1280664 RepID=UPI00041EE030|nr:HAD family hydrolase [Butyrivibrio sp. VCD2006]
MCNNTYTKNKVSKPAIFLDRDGVLTVEKGYSISSIKEMAVFPYAADCVGAMKRMGYLTIVITNQSAVAKGLFTEAELLEMNDKLLLETGVDAIYYCPHHPHGKVLEYTKVCNCRKPKTGMIEKALRDFDIDISHSFMVGDRAIDILLGEKVGVKTVLLNSGYGEENLEQECKPDYVMNNLIEFTEKLKFL